MPPRRAEILRHYGVSTLPQKKISLTFSALASAAMLGNFLRRQKKSTHTVKQAQRPMRDSPSKHAPNLSK
jgi:hypothetical protein